MVAETLCIITGFICLLALQKQIYQQDLDQARKDSYKEGYYAGLYQNVIKHSDMTD